MHYKAIIFDMDGTLVDSLFIWDVVWEALGKEFNGGQTITPTDADDKAVRTLILRDAMELIHQNYHLGKSGEELFRATNAIILDFYQNRVTLKEGVREFLEDCKSKGTRMVIASASARNMINAALRHTGIAHYFEEVLTCAELGIGKDRPDIYLLAEEHLGLPREDIWVFEDSHVALETAAKAGFPTQGIYDRCNPWQEEIRAVSSRYLGPGESFTTLIGE